ncbi:hypothetical protein BKA65DRAFT_530728 [Rhexocercosporidium sp. MPI-PUGE-AT-0058]|nr:hypothetical protein BKA65DRAFT_530728 [Rhexocercosporidium sp. MPI-PUGE-AT-0058]
MIRIVIDCTNYDGSVGGGILAMPSFIKQYGSKGKDGTYSLSVSDISVMTAVPTSGAVLGSVIAAYAGDRIGAIFGMSIVLIDGAAVVTSGINWATYANPTSLAYRLPLGLQVLWPIIIGTSLIFVHDSPTYFLIKGQDGRAKDSLRRGTNLRRTLVSLSIGNFQQLSGIPFATDYATIFLTQIGGSVNPFLLVLGGAITGLFLVDIIGGRTLAFTTFVIIFIINLIIGSLDFVDATNNPAGFGPLTYIVSSEVPIARVRNKTSAFIFLMLALFNLVVVYVLPYIDLYDIAGWMLICTVITYFCLPKTKGRSPAELDEMFAAKIPARRFREVEHYEKE